MHIEQDQIGPMFLRQRQRLLPRPRIVNAKPGVGQDPAARVSGAFMVVDIEKYRDGSHSASLTPPALAANSGSWANSSVFPNVRRIASSAAFRFLPDFGSKAR